MAEHFSDFTKDINPQISKSEETSKRIKWKKSESHSVVSNSLQPHGLYSPWNSPGQNTAVGSCFPSLGDLSNPRIELGSPGLLNWGFCIQQNYPMVRKRNKPTKSQTRGNWKLITSRPTHKEWLNKVLQIEKNKRRYLERLRRKEE